MLGHLLKPEYEELIRKRDWESLRIAFEDVDPADIAEILEDLPADHVGALPPPVTMKLPRSVNPGDPPVAGSAPRGEGFRTHTETPGVD